MKSTENFWARAQQLATEERYPEARQVLAQGFAAEPNHLWAIRLDLGLALVCGEPIVAVERGEALLRAGIDDSDVLANLALAHLHLGEIGTALPYCDQVLARTPHEAVAHLNKAAAYLRIGWYREALETCEAAAAQGVESFHLRQNRAVALAGLERWEESYDLYHVAKTQGSVDIKWLALGVEVLCALGRVAQAIDEVMDAMGILDVRGMEAIFDTLLLGGTPPALLTRRLHACQTGHWRQALTRVLNQQGYHEAVLTWCRDDTDGFCQMAYAVASAAVGDIHRAQTDLDTLDTQAARRRFLAYCYEEWRSHGKTSPAVPRHCSAIRLWVDAEYGRLERCDWSHWQGLDEQLADQVPVALDQFERNPFGQSPMMPFQGLVMPLSLALERRLAEATAAHIEAVQSCHSPSARLTHGKKRLRLGYVSADFRNHATAHLATALFGLHDRNRFEVFLYATHAGDGSRYRRRIQEGADVFREVEDKSVEQTASIIRQDRVDILVDMQGYSKYGRLGVFALRPAPVQVAFLVYPGTTGARFMDYIVADPVVLPESLRPFFTEEPLYLPGCYQSHDPLEATDGLDWTRARAGLPEDGVVFCVINQALKIDPETFDDWMAILRAVPHGCLWGYQNNPRVPVNLRREAARRGVDPARLVFADYIPKPSHLSRLRLADLFLDTHRYNAHTSARDALSAGLPLITRPGERFASRVAASLLTALGLDDLIMPSRAEYVATATRLGLDPAALACCKARVASATASPVWCDAEGYVRHLEAAFEAAFEKKMRTPQASR